MKENPALDMNNSETFFCLDCWHSSDKFPVATTCESMPYHFDGVFKTKTNEDGSVTADPPQFQVFQCRHAPSADDPTTDAGGRTLFANTALIYSQTLANNVSPFADDTKNRKWTVFTPTNKSFGGLVATQQAEPAEYIHRLEERWGFDVTDEADDDERRVLIDNFEAKYAFKVISLRKLRLTHTFSRYLAG